MSQRVKAAGRVIRKSGPYVKLVTDPEWYEEEAIPGVVKGEWRALANVDGALCVIAVTIKESEVTHP